MSDVAVDVDFSSSADAVFKVFADFGGIAAWGPGIVSCKVEGSGIGAVRSVEMPGGVVMQERLEALDDSDRVLVYSIVGDPPLIADYLATIKVSATGNGCRVDWSATFDAPEGAPAEAIAGAVSGAYLKTLAALKAHLGES